jgi:hypothetical protein
MWFARMGRPRSGSVSSWHGLSRSASRWNRAAGAKGALRAGLNRGTDLMIERFRDTSETGPCHPSPCVTSLLLWLACHGRRRSTDCEERAAMAWRAELYRAWGEFAVGVRISKSFKVAAGVRVRLNAKSTSVSVGGTGARYAVNSKGRRTTTVRVPGTGMSVQQVTGTGRSTPRQPASPQSQDAVTSPPVPKPGRSAPKGEKLLYKILATDMGAARWAAQCEMVAEKFPEQRIAAATLAGLFVLTENPAVAIRALGYVAACGVEIADDPFLRRYAPVKAYAMDAGGGQKVFVPLSRDLVITWLATVHLTGRQALVSRNLARPNDPAQIAAAVPWTAGLDTAAATPRHATVLPARNPNTRLMYHFVALADSMLPTTGSGFPGSGTRSSDRYSIFTFRLRDVSLRCICFPLPGYRSFVRSPLRQPATGAGDGGSVS